MDDFKFLAALGQKIRLLRLSKKITQHQLARLCNFEKASMSRIESGKTNVTVLTLRKISKALETDIGEFFADSLVASTVLNPGKDLVHESKAVAKGIKTDPAENLAGSN